MPWAQWCIAAERELRIDKMPTVISGPSFDCSKASTGTETAICDTADLWMEDRALNNLYISLRNAAAPEEKRMLIEGQRGWIRERDACADDVACIADRYRAWFLDLSRISAESG